MNEVPRKGLQNPVLPAATLLAWLDKEKKPISPSALCKKLKIDYKVCPASRFSDGVARGTIKRHETDSTPVFELTAKGRAFLKKNLHDVKTPAQVVKDFEARAVAPRRQYKKGSAPQIKMNVKANKAVDSIAQLLEDYNASLRMLAMIQAQIADFLQDNQPTEE